MYIVENINKAHFRLAAT